MITHMVIQQLTLLVPRLARPYHQIFLLICLVANLIMSSRAMQIVSASVCRFQTILWSLEIVPDWVDEEQEDSEEDFQWTMPKIVGIAAGALCIIAIVAVGIQQHLRRAELKIAKEIAMAQRRGSSDSETSFSSFDSEAEERERRRVKRQIKKEKRNQKSDVNSIISDDDKPKRRKKRTKYSESRAGPDDHPSGGTSSRGQTGGSRNFTEQDLAKAGLEMQRQKLQAKLQKYI